MQKHTQMDSASQLICAISLTTAGRAIDEEQHVVGEAKKGKENISASIEQREANNGIRKKRECQMDGDEKHFELCKLEEKLKEFYQQKIKIAADNTFKRKMKDSKRHYQAKEDVEKHTLKKSKKVPKVKEETKKQERVEENHGSNKMKKSKTQKKNTHKFELDYEVDVSKSKRRSRKENRGRDKTNQILRKKRKGSRRSTLSMKEEIIKQRKKEKENISILPLIEIEESGLEKKAERQNEVEVNTYNVFVKNESGLKDKTEQKAEENTEEAKETEESGKETEEESEQDTEEETEQSTESETEEETNEEMNEDTQKKTQPKKQRKNKNKRNFGKSGKDQKRIQKKGEENESSTTNEESDDESSEDKESVTVTKECSGKKSRSARKCILIKIEESTDEETSDEISESEIAGKSDKKISEINYEAKEQKHEENNRAHYVQRKKNGKLKRFLRSENRKKFCMKYCLPICCVSVDDADDICTEERNDQPRIRTNGKAQHKEVTASRVTKMTGRGTKIHKSSPSESSGSESDHLKKPLYTRVSGKRGETDDDGGSAKGGGRGERAQKGEFHGGDDGKEVEVKGRHNDDDMYTDKSHNRDRRRSHSRKPKGKRPTKGKSNIRSGSRCKKKARSKHYSIEPQRAKRERLMRRWNFKQREKAPHAWT